MREKTPAVSIIIPCFNCAQWIESCLDSLKRQTFTDFEVICVNDCSTDETERVIERYIQEAKIDIHLFSNKENSGPAISRNIGVNLAKGEFVSFCDSDDWVEDNFVERLYSSLIEKKADLCMCEYRKVYDSGRPSEDVNYLTDVDCLSNSDLIAYSKASMCLLMFKKSIIGELTVPNLRNGEDIAYVPCIESRAQRIIAIPEVLYNYRMREGSASKRPNPTVYVSLQNAFKYIETNIDHTVDREVIEYLGIRTILYGATINALKAGIDKKIIGKMISNFCVDYPGWKHNKYQGLLSVPKRLFVKFSSRRWLLVCGLLASIHAKVSI